MWLYVCSCILQTNIFELIWVEIGGKNKWKLLQLFLTNSHHKTDKNTTTTVRRYVDESVSPRTMGHSVEKNYQMTDHYLCLK